MTSELAVRSLIIGFVAATLAGIISLMLPKMYRAEARILPSLSGGSALPGLVGAGGLTNVLEIATQRQENPVQTFPEILLGRVVLDRTLRLPYPSGDSRSASTVLKALSVRGRTSRETQYRGILKMRDIVRVSANPRTGLISVRVETRDSTLSAYIANALIEELDHFNVEARRSQGRAVREFIASRLTEAQRELGEAELALVGFRRANLRIGNSPQLNLEADRLKRAVALRADTYQLLAHQYELARIEEFRDTPTFSVVEPPVPPFRKSKPQVLLNCVAGFALGSLISLFWETGLRTFGVALAPSRR